ncbi:Glutaminase A [Erysiphe neolycopersici]|uniref:Glutaminase A n=1 Tax=Erysiphe neolycopersici TaxID=212602 RepID=A0A420HVR3_9PEZI|nr:Glutaminase A [Erysiphe neolycopersici]
MDPLFKLINSWKYDCILFSTLIMWYSSGSMFLPARPPAIPLAVRSPYMNTWLNVGANGGNLSGSWPSSPARASQGTNNAVTAWTGLIQVDGVVFTWMGSPGGTNVEQESFEYTSTRSTFIMNVDQKIYMNVTFISPINPLDYKRQSIIGTYLEVTLASLDGAMHAVRLYADISAGINSAQFYLEKSSYTKKRDHRMG